MFKNIWKTIILSSLMVGFFCLVAFSFFLTAETTQAITNVRCTTSNEGQICADTGDYICYSGECMIKCTDTDNGLNYDVKGVATGMDESKTMEGVTPDLCGDFVGDTGKTSGIYLVENYCSSSNLVHRQWYECPNGCQEGVCLATPEIRTSDTDTTLPAYDETKVDSAREINTRTTDTSQSGSVRMTCGDSSGGDGLYGLCKGDTFYHNAGISVYNRAYDDQSLKLMATGLESFYFRVGLGQVATQKSVDGKYIFSFTYKEKSDTHGVYMQVSRTPVAVSAPSSASSDEIVRTCESIKTGGKRVIAFGDNKVYYAFRGYKYWFPNEEIYLSWFNNFAGITVVSQSELAGYITGNSICKNTVDVRVTEGNDTSADSGMLPAFNEDIRRTPNTNASEAVGMSCGDSEGGDGLYSACKGDTINHSSGVKILNRAYDPILVKFMLTGASQDYVRASLGGSVEVKTTDGKYTLKLTYTKKDATYGAFVQVETITNDTTASTSVEEGAVRRTETVLPAYDETKITNQGVNINFNVSVNDYPDHKNYDKNQNLSSAFVNMYKVELKEDGFFYVVSTDVQPVDANRKTASFSVAPGAMVYFEGFMTSRGAGSGQISKEAIGWSAPPYKNFSANGRVTDKLCQTNFNDTDHYLSCSDNLSTPFQDTIAN